MKFGDFDARMRIYETAHDHCVMPGIYMAVRLDGRCFTALTKKRHAFDAPYDIRFRDIMAKTAQHLMQCGFKEPLHNLACVCSVLCVSVQGGLRNKGFFLYEKTNAAMARTAPNPNIIIFFRDL